MKKQIVNRVLHRIVAATKLDWIRIGQTVAVSPDGKIDFTVGKITDVEKDLINVTYNNGDFDTVRKKDFDTRVIPLDKPVRGNKKYSREDLKEFSLKVTASSVDEYKERYLAMEDFVDEARERGMRVAKNVGDATVTVYHGTSVAKADSIRSSRKFMDGAWFAPTKKYATDHAKMRYKKEAEVMEVKVDPRDLEITGAEGEFFAENELTNNGSYWSSKR